MNYYRRYVGDYLRDTSRLSLLEHGAYNVLLDCYYLDEKPLPADSEEVYRMARAMRPDERRAVDKVLGAFFTLEADGYHQKRVDAEIAVAQSTIAKQRASGSDSAAKRWSEDGSTDRSTHGSTHPPTNGSTHAVTHAPPIQPLNHSTTQPPSLSAAARGSRLPDDWRLTTEQIEWAIGAQPTWDAEHALKVAEAFRDHWKAIPGSKGVKLDWDATWRNWVRREGPVKLRVVQERNQFAGGI